MLAVNESKHVLEHNIFMIIVGWIFVVLMSVLKAFGLVLNLDYFLLKIHSL